MTPEQIQQMADGLPPSQIGMDHEEVITHLAEKNIQLQEQVKALTWQRESALIECAAAKIAIQYIQAGNKDFTLNTPKTDAFIAEIKAQGLDMLASQCDGYPLNHVYTFTKNHAEEFAAQLRAAPDAEGGV